MHLTLRQSPGRGSAWLRLARQSIGGLTRSVLANSVTAEREAHSGALLLVLMRRHVRDLGTLGRRMVAGSRWSSALHDGLAETSVSAKLRFR